MMKQVSSEEVAARPIDTLAERAGPGWGEVKGLKPYLPLGRQGFRRKGLIMSAVVTSIAIAALILFRERVRLFRPVPVKAR